MFLQLWAKPEKLEIPGFACHWQFERYAKTGLQSMLLQLYAIPCLQNQIICHFWSDWSKGNVGGVRTECGLAVWFR